MRLKISRSKNAASLYVTKTIYVDKKEKTITVEKLGTEAELRKKLGDQDPYVWARNYINELNQKEKEECNPIPILFSPQKQIPIDEENSFYCGYLFLQQLYHQLGIPKICSDISEEYKFTYNLDAIFSRLLYGRILFPSSKLATYQESKKLLEQPDFQLQHVYRGLEVLAKESDKIQATLYQNSLSICKRNDKILFYDCINFYFEITEAQGLKKYGISKEHRPNPIVQMGLFMDGDGIPLAFNLHSGNTNEQITLQPLEKRILSDFKLSKFVVCTDAGLSSNDNRKFNDRGDRAFTTTQSIKKLKKHLREWALDFSGWKTSSNSKENYDLTQVSKHYDSLPQEAIEEKEILSKKIFYKERWINENGLEQKLIVSFSFLHKRHQAHIREKQIQRAIKLVEENPERIKKRNANDPKRFINSNTCTSDGEKTAHTIYSINEEAIEKEAIYDGYYAICSNLEDDAKKIIKINNRRWEIEENFRIMKTEFLARPVYLQREERIQAHFTTCFTALLLYRLLEKKLNNKFTCCQILSEIQNMKLTKLYGSNYIPSYKRTILTDALHEAFDFRTDYEIISHKNIKNILKISKTNKRYAK